MNGDPEKESPALTGEGTADEHARIAIAMIRDEPLGLRLAGEFGLAEGKARALRDRLLQAAPAVLSGTLEAQARRIDEQTAELARLVRLAEEYRTGRRSLTAPRAEALIRLEELRGSASGALPAARSWAVRRLPAPLRRRLKSILARVIP